YLMLADSGTVQSDADSEGLVIGYGQGIRTLTQGKPIPEGAVSMTGPGSPLGVAETALNLAPEVKVPVVLGTIGKVTKGLTRVDFPAIAPEVSQKQLRHIAGRAEHAARGGSYLNSMEDAQAVLDAYHSGSATILGKSSQGFP